MVFCPDCGSENSNKSKFCVKCGLELETKSKDKITKKVMKKSIDMVDPRKSPAMSMLKKKKTKNETDFKCPACRTKNHDDQKSCIKCGKDFTETLGFFRGGYSSSKMWRMDTDLEITQDDLIIYPRSKITGKRKKKIKRYPREDLQEVRIGKTLNQLRFYYNGKNEVYTIKPEYMGEIKTLLGTTLKKKRIEVETHEERVNKGMIKGIKGYNGQLELYEHKIIIRREGMKSFLTHGWKGDKEILINHISSIQLKKPGIATRGYIQFAFLGGTENKKGIFDAASDENSILYNPSQEKEFSEIKEMIESQMLKLQNINTSNQSLPETNNFDDLEKLAELKEKGIITEEEFQAMKKQILGL